LSDKQITTTISHGKGRMPSFAWLGAEDSSAFTELLRYLKTESPSGTGPLDRGGQAMDRPQSGRAQSGSDQSAAQYVSMGYNKFLDPDGYPAVVPPWGTLNAIDLNTGKYLWKIPLGEYPELAARGLKDTGSENYGGPIVTAGGVVFIGATVFDHKFRAFDAGNGALLWEAKLPGAARATPATYMADGRQFVVIASGGARFVDQPVPPRGVYVAYALSE
jgi:quinoprotein glucose dehydrogenase